MLINNVKENTDVLKKIANSSEELLKSQQKKNKLFLILGLIGTATGIISLIISQLK